MGIVLRYSSLVLMLSVCAVLQAQETPEVHKINGKKYYLHVVEPGNTLYGISRLYNTDIDEILHENPLVGTEGLKVNQTLLILVTNQNKKELGGLVEETKEFIVHKVQPKQTLYSISKQYSIEMEALLKANPEIEENGLKADSELKIPMAEVRADEPSSLESAKPDSLEGHIVEKGETLYGLSKKYDVDITALKEANGGLPFGLKQGMVIRIPGRLVPLPEEPSIPEDTASMGGELLADPDSTGAFNVGILFPFYTAFPDSGEKDFKISEASRISINFYRGLKFGFDSLFSDHSAPVNLRLLDTGADSSRILEWAASGRLDSLDAIIGPFYTDQYQLVCDTLARQSVPVICPVPKPSKILFQRSMAMKTIPSSTMQLHSLAELLAAQYQDSNLVLINSNKITDLDNIEFFLSSYQKARHIPDTSKESAIKEVKLWDINRESLKMRFGDSGSYVLVVPSINRVFVSQLLSGLYDLVLTEGDDERPLYHFTVIGLEEWLDMEDILDIRHLHKLNVTLTLSNYLDYGDYKVDRFVNRFRAHCGYEPDAYTVQGFDLVLYLKEQLKDNPDSWSLSPEDHYFSGVAQDFYFKRITDGSGVENRHIELYEYEQFRLKRVTGWPSQKIQ